MSYKLIQGRKKWNTPLTDAEYQICRGMHVLYKLSIINEGDSAISVCVDARNGYTQAQVFATRCNTLGTVCEHLFRTTEGLGVYLKETPPPDPSLQLPPVGFGIERSHHLKVLGEREDLKVQVKLLTEQLNTSRSLDEIESEGADKTAEDCLKWMHKATNLESENEQLKSKLRKISGILTQ